ncbi:MAG: radical SAM family heme chaperone HemW [Streptosporangiaceae bacterium]
MPATLPDGDLAPADGALPPSALEGVGTRPFGVYVHVPYCATRCGYCDFNTYTAAELGPGVSREAYADQAVAELHLARGVLGAIDVPVSTVFFGGGTPTLLPPDDLGRVLAAVDAEFGLAPGAEITTEANPESVDLSSLARLREHGFTRVSFGMQSARPHVLNALDRVHTPGQAERSVAEARSAGFEHVNLDLIYGALGETDADWQASLDAAVSSGANHISAYALIVEPGTHLAGRVRRGEVPAPDEDVLADRYLMADETLARAGFGWYEISNWARGAGARCHHNLLYWTGGHWWGAGPGAHSHVGGVRWWNRKHPAAYAARLARGESPAQAREILSPEERRLERVMLETRLASGCRVDILGEGANGSAVSRAVERGLAEHDAYARGRVVLTRRGRLLADAVIRDLVA